MNTTAFTIFDASAGSGKTYTLTKEYLKILLLASNDDAYKKIISEPVFVGGSLSPNSMDSYASQIRIILENS